jgi:hypothetical protein
MAGIASGNAERMGWGVCGGAGGRQEPHRIRRPAV